MSTGDVLHRSCPICEASCGLVLRLDPEERRVLGVTGDENDPRSRGYLCPKAFGMQAVFEDADRIRRPLRRIGADWEEIGWDAALDEVAGRLVDLQRSHGSGCIASYIGNPIGSDVGAQLYLRHLTSALASPRAFSAITMDQFPKVVSSRLMYGNGAVLPIPDVDRTDFLLVLGGNPVVSQGSLMSAPDMKGRLRSLRERGGRLVVVDPRRSETAAVADEHVFIRPGTDAFFLFAMVHAMFEENLLRPGRLAEFTDGMEDVRALAEEFAPERVSAITGIAAHDIRSITRAFAGAKRACCYGRIGTCTQEFGTLASWLVDVVSILSGNLDSPGGAMFPRPATGQIEPSSTIGAEMPLGRWRTVVRGLPEVNGTLPSAALAEEIDSAGEDRIRALVTISGNPVLSTANGARLSRALEQLDFMVGLDIYMNETTRHADVLLPSTVQLEFENYDYLFEGTTTRNMARWSGAAFAPEPGSMHQWQIFLELAARMTGRSCDDLDDAAFDTLLRRRLATRPDIEPSYVRARLPDRGPMRLLDVMIRSGPYGDGFDDDADGLSLSKLHKREHATDLGPLEPRFPELLRTPGRRIVLAPEHITRDVVRLRSRLETTGSDTRLRLVGRRQLRNMNSWLHNVKVFSAGRTRCTLLMNPADAERCGVEDGGRAEVRSRVGAVTVDVQVSDEMMAGVVSLPHGFGHADPKTRLAVAASQQPGVNSNELTDERELDVPSGTSVANGIPVEVRSA
ncbi:MAG: molybdopterin-dependent oxidoreductase [Candidatus Binatia bacterium]|nr:molybdopterin-dependent oxidoreductase [Candidatus Binatia bacterium]